mmetsp:Transcript_44272/g.103531  ORF Transcript_44272/g.103531 Transcript_44272/m.103531 type:complete len:334 (-) Transcript_44272:134-1135(-)
MQRHCRCREAREPVGLGLQHGERLHGGDGGVGRERGREAVAGAGETLVRDDVFGAGAEAADGAEAVLERADEHVNRRRRHAARLGGAAAGSAKRREAERVVDDEVEPVDVAQPEQLDERRHVARIGEEPLDEDETAWPLGRRRVPHLLLGALRGERRLQSADVVVSEGAHLATREAHAHRRREVHAVVDEEKVALAHEGGDDRGDGRDAERVDDGLLGAQEGGQLVLQLEVHVERAVEAARTASAAAVSLERALGRLTRQGCRGEPAEIGAPQVEGRSDGLLRRLARGQLERLSGDGGSLAGHLGTQQRRRIHSRLGHTRNCLHRLCHFLAHR